MFFKAICLVVQAGCVQMFLLLQLLKSLQEEIHVSVKENNHFSVVRAHRAHRMGEQCVGPRDKGDLCVLFNEGVRMPQDPQSFGVCVKGRMLYIRSFWARDCYWYILRVDLGLFLPWRTTQPWQMQIATQGALRIMANGVGQWLL